MYSFGYERSLPVMFKGRPVVICTAKPVTKCGEPIRDLQALTGHATAASTLQRYTHHHGTSARRTADAMGEIFSEGI